MSANKSISLNAAFTAFVQLASKGIVFLVAIVIARIFGPEDYGSYAIALTLTTIFMAFTEIGLEQQFVRTVSNDPGTLSETLGAHIYAVIFLALAAVICMPIAGHLLGYTNTALRIIEIFVIYRFFNRLQYPFIALMRVTFQAHLTAMVQFLSLSSQALALGLIIYFDWSITDVALSQVAIAIGTFILWIFATRALLHSATFNWVAIKKLLKGAMEFAPQTISWVIYFNVGTFILSFFADEAEVGVYAALFRILFILYIVPEAFILSCSTVLYQTFSAAPERFNALVSFSNKLMLFVGMTATYLLTIGGETIISLVYGKAFLSGVPILFWLLPGILCKIANLGILETLTTANQQRFRNRVLQVGLVSNILLNFLLIPFFGAIGTAIAASLAEIFMLLMAVGSVFKLRLHLLSAAEMPSILGFVAFLGVARLSFHLIGVSPWIELCIMATAAGAILVTMLWRHRSLLKAGSIKTA